MSTDKKKNGTAIAADGEGETVQDRHEAFKNRYVSDALGGQDWDRLKAGSSRRSAESPFPST